MKIGNGPTKSPYFYPLALYSKLIFWKNVAFSFTTFSCVWWCHLPLGFSTNLTWQMQENHILYFFNIKDAISNTAKS